MGSTFSDWFLRIPAMLGNHGWALPTAAFKNRGYSDAELYGTTWGPGDPLQANLWTLSKDVVMRQRKFIEAVIEYSGASKIDIIAHSAGVPLAERAILGGWASDQNGERYYIGKPLRRMVDTFIGINGVTRGVPMAPLMPLSPMFHHRTGYSPGIVPPQFGAGPLGMSEFLRDLHTQEHYQGEHVYAIWSGVDELLAPGFVHGEHTSRIPGQDGEIVFYGPPYSHVLTKDLTGHLQEELVSRHGLSAVPFMSTVNGIPKLPPRGPI
jgi:hypothetical protein